MLSIWGWVCGGMKAVKGRLPWWDASDTLVAVLLFHQKDRNKIWPTFFFFYFKDFIYLFLERGEGRKKKRERNINVWEIHWSVVSRMSPTGDLACLACNPGMCPDWETNWWPFSSQVRTRPTEPHQPGLPYFLINDAFIDFNELV